MAEAKREMVHFRLSPAGIAKLDEVRGSWSRSEYIRRAVALAVRQNMKGPERVEW